MSRIDLPIPAYAAVRSGDNHATEDAVRQIVDYLDQWSSQTQRRLTKALDRFDPHVYVLSPSAALDNFDYQKAGVLNFTGASSVNLTGIIAPEVDGAMLVLHTTGAGTITVKHQSGSSDAVNQIVSASGADRALSTNKSLILCYLNGYWRDISFQ